jgi:hypothetical protein
MKFPRLARVFVIVAVVSGLLAWGYREFDHNDTIPLIDRNDPAYADAFFYLDRRAMTTLMGRSNQTLEDLSPERLQIVRQFSRARLSQAVYEAGIARVEPGPDRGVRITVPSYRRAGRKLEVQVMRQFSSPGDAGQQQRIRKFFLNFGAPQQILTVTTGIKEIDGRPLAVYSIHHEFSGGGMGPMSVGSTLHASLLVIYAPFQPLFPKL